MNINKLIFFSVVSLGTLVSTSAFSNIYVVPSASCQKELDKDNLVFLGAQGAVMPTGSSELKNKSFSPTGTVGEVSIPSKPGDYSKVGLYSVYMGPRPTSASKSDKGVMSGLKLTVQPPGMYATCETSVTRLTLSCERSGSYLYKFTGVKISCS